MPRHSARLAGVSESELIALRKSIQALCQATNPLGKCMDHVPDDVEMMVDCFLQLHSLTHLELSENRIDGKGVEALAKACKGKIRCHLGWPPPLGGLAPEDWDR